MASFSYVIVREIHFRDRSLDELSVVIEGGRVDRCAANRLLTILTLLANLNLFHFVQKYHILTLDVILPLYTELLI